VSLTPRRHIKSGKCGHDLNSRCRRACGLYKRERNTTNVIQGPPIRVVPGKYEVGV
jgi:hypothetical protein